MAKPEDGFSEAVRARIMELTGKDPGQFAVGDIFPGPNYHQTSFKDRVEAIAQSLVQIADGDCEILYPAHPTRGE